MHNENKLAFNLTLVATILALLVIMLGSYTRLRDAGLGCPDWPGCYGQVIAPDTPQRVQEAMQVFPTYVVEQTKAWTEMIHRYVAGTLGLLIFIIAIITIRKRHLGNQPIAIPLALIAIVIFQALLGKWTVTMRLLPTVVMMHLMTGLLLLSLLWLLTLRLGKLFYEVPRHNVSRFKPWAILAAIIVFAQIFLGAWTSTNYAALSCPDFPYCQGQLIPTLNLHSAYHFSLNTQINYQGGVLDNIARMTIHVMHRLGALITGLYLCWLTAWLLFASQSNILKRVSLIMLLLVLVQIGLGILNVIWLLPVVTAVLHTAIAALLLLSLVTLNYTLAVVDQRPGRNY